MLPSVMRTWLMWVCLLAAERQEAQKVFYGELGGSVVLRPDLSSVTGPITNITWIHDPDVAMKWAGGQIESFHQFRDRGDLNASTGEMTIRALTRGDSGSYTAQINNIDNSQTELKVISPVSKPSVSTLCDAGLTRCLLRCDSNTTTDAEPVSYTWWTDDMKKTELPKEQDIIEVDLNYTLYRCQLENPVSEEVSQPISNPLIPISAETPLYGRLGGSVVLRPDLSITNIQWKHGPDVAMKWAGGGQIESFHQFRDRGDLNTSTGELTIRGLTRGDSGSYTAQINSRDVRKTQLKVISPVSKPSVSTFCDAGFTRCILRCDSNTPADAEPVSATWWKDNMNKTELKEQMIITKEEDWNYTLFSCQLENPVSEEVSQPISNPLIPKKTFYGKRGGSVVLRPDLSSVTGPITNITWIHDPDVAMKWAGGQIESFHQFRDRADLNTSTGEITIRGLTRGDDGLYTANINNFINSQTQLKVISPVSKPSVSTFCEAGLTRCLLRCDSNTTTDAEPVSYTWWTDNMKTVLLKEQEITKEEDLNNTLFSCQLENPVSEEVSQPISNPLIPKSDGGGRRRTRRIVIISVVVAILLLVT